MLLTDTCLLVNVSNLFLHFRKFVCRAYLAEVSLKYFKCLIFIVIAKICCLFLNCIFSRPLTAMPVLLGPGCIDISLMDCFYLMDS